LNDFANEIAWQRC